MLPSINCIMRKKHLRFLMHRVERPIIMEYKYYNQNNYPDIPYADGTVADSGCGLCAACMVVENMMGRTFTPEEAVGVANEAGAVDDTGTDMTLLAPAVCEKFGLTYELTCDHGKMLQFLQNGDGMAIANSGGDRDGWIGVFTHYGHFITLVSAKGREVCVMDPSMREGKYDEEGRQGKVRVDGNLAYVDIAVLARDCDNRYPSYCLFRKK